MQANAHTRNSGEGGGGRPAIAGRVRGISCRRFLRCFSRVVVSACSPASCDLAPCPGRGRGSCARAPARNGARAGATFHPRGGIRGRRHLPGCRARAAGARGDPAARHRSPPRRPGQVLRASARSARAAEPGRTRSPGAARGPRHRGRRQRRGDRGPRARAARAGVGASVVLLGSAAARRTDGLTTLALGAASCALVDPAATHDLALQLSVTGIAGLILLARPLRDLLPVPRPASGAPIWRRFPEHLLGLGCATGAAALCTAPLLATAFHRLSLVSIAANALGLLPGLAAIPVATLLVPFDLLLLWWIADLLAAATLAASHFFASLPFATAVIAAPGLIACVLWYAGVLLCVRRAFRAALAPWALLAILAGSRAAIAHAREGMNIVFLAVGQGDSAVVQLPEGHAMLIDAGGDLRWPGKFDPGARDIVPALAELGIHRLDVVVLTHPHPDHAGGMMTVLDRMSVGELWMTAERDPIASAVRARAARRGVPVREPHETTLGGVRVEVLSRFEEGWSLNDNSIVLRLVHGGVAVLFAGDAEALAEADLAQSGTELRAQVLKAPHHGSRTSSTEAFLRRVAPAFTVYCVGAGNRFGFPNPEVVERTPGAHFLTSEGAVVAESDGHTVRVHGWRE